MKKFVFLNLFLFLILINFVYAQEIEIGLVEYEADSGRSTISVSNLGDRDLHDIAMSVDSIHVPVVQLLSPGDTVYSTIGVDAGEYLVSVDTKEGVSESRILLFSQSRKELGEKKEELKRVREETLKREEELKRVADENKRQSEIELQQERERATQLGVFEEKEDGKRLIWVAVGVFVIVVIIFWWSKKRK